MLQPHKAFGSESNQAVLIVLDNGKQMQFSCTAEDYVDGLKQYESGKMIQDAFHFLNNDEREFLMSGLTREEFDHMFPEDSVFDEY